MGVPVNAADYSVLYKLWESSWRDDAVVLDVATDTYADPSRIRKIHHKGRYFDVAGPSFVEPSPQRTPLLYQAGSSTAGINFGARHAEAVFMSGPVASKVSRERDCVLMIDSVASGFSSSCGEARRPRSVRRQSAVEAHCDCGRNGRKGKCQVRGVPRSRQSRRSQGLVRRVSDRVKMRLTIRWIGQDLSIYNPGEDLRQSPVPIVAGITRGYAALYPEIKLWDADTLADHFKLGGMGPVLVGGPQKVANELQKWIDDTDIDGFSESISSPVFDTQICAT